MSKLSKKAILAVLSLVLTFVALGATTFAWFSLGTTATINDFEVEVRGGEGLEVQLVGQDGWYSVINSTVMDAFLDTKFPNGKMDAVTFDSTEDKFMKFSEVNPNGTVSLVEAEENVDYLEFELKFRTEQDSPKLDITNFAFTSTAITWTSDLGFKNEHDNDISSGDSFNVYPHFAARLQIEGTQKHTFQHDTTEAGNIGLELSQGAHHYVATKWGVEELNTEGANADALINTTEATDIVAWTTETIEDKQYKVATVTVRVWLEGWDGNAYDAIFDGEFKVGFSFGLQEQ